MNMQWLHLLAQNIKLSIIVYFAVEKKFQITRSQTTQESFYHNTNKKRASSSMNQHYNIARY